MHLITPKSNLITIDLSNFPIIYLRKQEHTKCGSSLKLRAPNFQPCSLPAAFANPGNFALNFRSHRGRGERRWIREGAVPGAGAALQPAGPRRGRSAQRCLRSQGKAAAFGGCWRYTLPLDLRTSALLSRNLNLKDLQGEKWFDSTAERA